MMTAFEKFLIGLIALYLLSHAVLRWGLAAGVPAQVIALAEGIATQ